MNRRRQKTEEQQLANLGREAEQLQRDLDTTHAAEPSLQACGAMIDDVEGAQDPFFQNYEGQSKWVVPDDRGCNCIIS